MFHAPRRHRNQSRRPSLVVRTALVIAAVGAAIAAVPTSKPEDVGISTERLQRIKTLVQRYVDEKQIAGAVTAVTRKGRTVHFEAQGLMDIEQKTPMRKDAIFRMASMSKPVTGVAILMLVEEGKVRLTDPVSRFIPGFRDTEVAMPERTPSAAPAAPAATGERPAARLTSTPCRPPRSHRARSRSSHTAGLETGGAGAREAARTPRARTETDARDYIPKLGRLTARLSAGQRSGAIAGSPASTSSAASSKSRQV